MDPRPHPVFLSPSLPSELLHYVTQHCSYPTTLVICSSRSDFLSSLTQDIILHQQQEHDQAPHQHRPSDSDSPNQPTAVKPGIADPDPDPCPGEQEQEQNQDQSSPRPPDRQPPINPCPPPQNITTHHHHHHYHHHHHPLLTSTLQQTATARHIRTVFTPTVTHLRAFLSVFSLRSSTVRPPPPPPRPARTTTSINTSQDESEPPPLLLVYGFLALHRDTSEWSVQGMSSSAAGLVEAAAREGVRAVICEAPGKPGITRYNGGVGEEDLLEERVPVLSAGLRRGLVAGDSGWVGKTVEVKRVLARWFRFEEPTWMRDGE